jgi:hypothetical protein
MFVKDHPPPHFHALYGEQRARVFIETGAVLDGDLPPRAARLVRERAVLRRAELEDNSTRAERMEPLVRIELLP